MIDVDSDSSEGSVPNTPPRPTSSSTTGSSVGLNTTKSRPGSFATSLPSTVPLTTRDSEGPEAHAKQHQGAELKLQCDWNGAPGSLHGVSSKPTSPQLAEKSKGHGATGNERTQIRLPSLNIPNHRTNSETGALGHIAHHLDTTPSLRLASNSNPDGLRRASSGSERSGWSTSPPTSMPPPPLPPQSCAPQLESFPRIAERAPGTRTNPLAVSELIHREATGTGPPPTPRPTAPTAGTSDRVPSLASEFIDVLKLRERVSDANMPTFLNELNHQLSLTGLLREAREHICGTLDLTEWQRNSFAQQTMSMLRMDDAARDMRGVVARAVVGMGRRDLAGFEYELVHMLDGGLHAPASPYREALCCAAYAARFPEEQQAELRRQLKRMPPAAFQGRQPHAGAKGGGAQPRAHNLPPLRECEKLGDIRRAGTTNVKVRKEQVRPANYSLREFPIFPSH